MTILSSGEPPNSFVRQSITEGRDAVRGTKSLVQTRRRVIELAKKVSKRLVNILLDSRSTGNSVSPQTCTRLGLHMEEELADKELQLADGSPAITQGRVKLHIKCGQYKNVAWARV